MHITNPVDTCTITDSICLGSRKKGKKGRRRKKKKEEESKRKRKQDIFKSSDKLILDILRDPFFCKIVNIFMLRV